ncbi:MAG: gamma-glutamyl-gamma-aminobutyrate hydrolase family protein [Akkermansiaceae bacterium]|nr:gamma-glutamyl-gamma-aminobutyrate hydrolase family protein [Akkermansiaceae bacterium]
MATESERPRPLIGVTGPQTGGRVLWLFTRLAIRLAGGRARRLVAGGDLALAACDGFVISGGADINPELYGEAALAKKLQYDLERDALEQKVIRHATKEGKPLFGICRGMQILNVTLGGSLYQEAKDILEDFLPSRSLISKFIGRRSVTIEADSQLFRILGGYSQYNINSIHHQAVNRVAEGLVVVAREENGIVQAIEPRNAENKPWLIGVQWHPELMLHAHSARSLFRSLVDASRERASPNHS